MPEVRWAVSPHDERYHALDAARADAAPARGFVDAKCGMTLPAGQDFTTTEAPQPPLCWPCALVVATDLPDPGRFGTT